MSPSFVPNPVRAAPSASASDQAIYVYGFIDAARIDGLSHSPFADQPLSLHRLGTIVALMCQVAIAEFRGDEGERNLADPAWLMPRIRYHETTVESAMAWSPVFPTRFATLFRSLDSLTEFMRRHQTAIAGFFRRVTGQQEWAFKLTAELGDLTALDHLAAELWPEWLCYSPGTRYLRLRQVRPRLLDEAGKRAARLMPGIVEGLRTLITDIRPLARSAGPDDQYIASYALLVPVGQQSALHERLNELALEWKPKNFRLMLSGRWPPYSFRPALDDTLSPQNP